MNSIEFFLKKHLNFLGDFLSEELISNLTIYVGELIGYNRWLNLLGTSEEEIIIKKHIGDVLAPYFLFPKKAKIADVGSGAGLPGIPLALFLKESHFTLIESKKKKCFFLEHIKKLLKINNVSVLNKNVNEINDKFNIITMRAFSDIPKALKVTRKMCFKKTSYFFYKGRQEMIEKELGGLQDYKKELIRLKVSFIEGERHLVKLVK